MDNLNDKQKELSAKEARHSLVGPPNLWKSKRDFQMNFLLKKDLKPSDVLMDIGCGTLRGGIPLIDYLDEAHYFGIEARDFVLEEGKQELLDAKLGHKKPTLICSADIANISLQQTFDVIWSFAVLIHMTDDILHDTLEFVQQHLSSTGVMYANVHIGQANGVWHEFPVVWRPFQFYEEACEKYNLSVTNLGSLKQYGHIVNKNHDQEDKVMLEIRKL